MQFHFTLSTPWLTSIVLVYYCSWNELFVFASYVYHTSADTEYSLQEVALPELPAKQH